MNVVFTVAREDSASSLASSVASLCLTDLDVTILRWWGVEVAFGVYTDASQNRELRDRWAVELVSGKN